MGATRAALARALDTLLQEASQAHKDKKIGQGNLFAGGAADFFEDIYARRHAIGDPGTDPGARERVIERLRTLYRRRGGRQSQARIDGLFAGTGLFAELQRASSYAELFSIFMESQARDAGSAIRRSHSVLSSTRAMISQAMRSRSSAGRVLSASKACSRRFMVRACCCRLVPAVRR